MSRRLAFWLRLGVSLGLVVYVFARVEWGEFADTLRQAHPLLIALYLGVAPLMLLTSTLKWSVLLGARGLRVRLRRLYALYFVGHFFNHLMPSNVGGDAVRVYQLARYTDDLPESAASVFVERMTGLTTLLGLVLVAVAANLGVLEDPRVMAALVAGFSIYALVLWLALHGRLVGAVLTVLDRGPLSGITRHAREMYDAVRSYVGTRGVWLPALALSAAFYLLVIANAWIGCLAFGTRARIGALFLVVPLILLVTMLPISVGGIGLLEWAYFTLFEQVGLPGSLGLSVALLNRATGIVLGGVGGLIHARSTAAPDPRRDYASA